jgi:hypothetical protein
MTLYGGRAQYAWLRLGVNTINFYHFPNQVITRTTERIWGISGEGYFLFKFMAKTQKPGWKLTVVPEDGPDGFRKLTITTRPDCRRHAIRAVESMSDVLETLMAAAQFADETAS